MKEKTLKSFVLVKENFGNAIGKEKIKELKIKDFVIKEVHFVKYEKSAIRIMISY